MKNQTKRHPIVQIGYDVFKGPSGRIFTCKDQEIEDFLNQTDEFPHLFVLIPLLKSIAKEEKVYEMLYCIAKHFKSFSMQELSRHYVEEYKKLFLAQSFSKNPEEAATIFFHAIVRIHTQYQDAFDHLYKERIPSSDMILALLQFYGASERSALQTVDSLVKDSHVRLKDYFCVGCTPSATVKRVLYRLGLIDANADNTTIIYTAVSLNKRFPGVIELATKHIAQTVCLPINPMCPQCRLQAICQKKLDIVVAEADVQITSESIPLR